MSNFNFLKQSFSFLYSDAAEAEKHTLSAPKYAAILCRSTLEKAINWLYDNDPDLERPYNDNTLSILMHQTCFKNIVNRLMFREINNIRLTGNNAAHGKSVNQTESMVALKGLFRFLSFVARYYSEEYPEVPPFDEALIPDEKQKDKTLAELQKVVDELTLKAEKLQEERTRANELAKENEILSIQVQKQKETILARKEERKQIPEAREPIPQLIPEALTRKIFIDSLLKEAGWDNLREGRELEYPVFGMPASTNPTSTGYADYVLWGDNGLPLAVIEAKKTSVDAHTGQYQAELYANCLENMTGQRPVIFYTNGFETHIWDDAFYPPREVSGFYTKNELQLLIDRRKTRLDIRNYKVNTEIAGRPYQMEAIQRVAETLVTQKTGKLAGKNRKALLVMATGSGKTRVSAAIVDMLTKCNWVKRVLFLADRNALVTQAKNAFTTYLPQLSSIDLTREKEDNGTRLVFSTYQTIMNKIDSLKNEESRFYSPGHFDLVIIDEAHRSVYKKYGAIFRYFDSLLIGLTATPKTDIDRNTYNLFDIDDNNPTFAYELNQAVTDGYLVPPKAIKVPLRFPREGIRYHDLSDAEKEEYEEKFGDPTTGEADDTIGNNALNSWLFNTNTIDRVLAFMMDNGIKTH
ncbi:MAG TPA: DEAD/DEAH box helicase family protein, partial [Prolixibacteraceae bacterium]|nr:DEAD/DEAH box helicase family protein [Prolixibacteraceae bacterium]